MRMLMVSTALSTVILAFAAGGKAEAANFDEASLQGAYSIMLTGFAEGQALQPLPTWSVGVIQFDGAGRIVAVEGVVNVAGCVILKQAGTTGTYSVNPNGTGRAEVRLTQETVSTQQTNLCTTLDQGMLAENFQFAFDFAINTDGLDVIATSWEGPNGPIAIGSSGQAKPQVRSAKPHPK